MFVDNTLAHSKISSNVGGLGSFGKLEPLLFCELVSMILSRC